MPIYEYACKCCGKEFELLRRIRDDTAPICQYCQSENVVKVVSLSQFQLKGDGWANDLYDKSVKSE